VCRARFGGSEIKLVLARLRSRRFSKKGTGRHRKGEGYEKKAGGEVSARRGASAGVFVCSYVRRGSIRKSKKKKKKQRYEGGGARERDKRLATATPPPLFLKVLCLRKGTNHDDGSANPNNFQKGERLAGSCTTGGGRVASAPE